MAMPISTQTQVFRRKAVLVPAGSVFKVKIAGVEDTDYTWTNSTGATVRMIVDVNGGF